ncbi:hypothetical protein [Aneurinibacillus aneurinilyticus]|jgi:ABC-type phosphate/phosphonate transport system substrate-binding protein|uniref:Spore coat protein W n=2 Tax=Aneurinibacillus aneurinilyticus TaxID=1391 RepID=A0A848CY48_ANEAE|nr:hypothetical protein [Aneurinibacillus aneurinilyticus]ERI09931.1 hypothetical protein HMPREF0083_02026 [Aneurinibacillus aneurinilyticus ATCC 12856]MCI1695460.1 hypothetical protein [Aneurinibacillus aneurinilyticus]MED0673215.1 hypothetical protein [Aneurinibacillus aneurinilyticus]MED0706769.1 hypothetical protein [Aneurinibacillus aneurinilyticus]MED0725732.1 hypothetical protein [Aneurinibacillus aneurinilyticus]
MSKGEENDFSHLSKSLADLIVSDVFERNKVVVRKDIPEEQKQKIRKLAQDLQEQVDAFLQKERGENL